MCTHPVIICGSQQNHEGQQNKFNKSIFNVKQINKYTGKNMYYHEMNWVKLIICHKRTDKKGLSYNGQEYTAFTNYIKYPAWSHQKKYIKSSD